MRRGKVIIMGLLSLTAFGGAFWLASRKPAMTGEVGREQQNGEIGLKLEPSIFDLGTIRVNREAHFAAVIHNYGQQPIKLARVQKSCGDCTSVSVAKQVCPPGEDVELKGTYVPRRPGRFRQLVKVIEAVESAPEHILEVVGEAESSISAFPESVLLNPSVFENKAVVQVIIFRNSSGEQAILREPTRLPEGISVRITKGEMGPKQETKVVVRAEPRFFLDSDLHLSFPTSHPIQDSVTLMVRLRPKDGFTVVPSRISLGVISKQDLEKLPVRLSLIGTGVKNVAIARIIPPSFLKLAKESTRSGDRMEMEFAFARSLQGIRILAKITYRITCPRVDGFHSSICRGMCVS